MQKEKLKITDSCGNVFLDLGFSPEEANILAMRAQLMGELRIKIRDMEWTQAEAAKVLGSVAQAGYLFFPGLYPIYQLTNR